MERERNECPGRPGHGVRRDGRLVPRTGPAQSGGRSGPSLHAAGLDQWRAGVLGAGLARYVSTIEMQSGQPSILFEEEADTDVTWSMDLYRG